jgi:hypothetical protein
MGRLPLLHLVLCTNLARNADLSFFFPLLSIAYAQRSDRPEEPNLFGLRRALSSPSRYMKSKHRIERSKLHNTNDVH